MFDEDLSVFFDVDDFAERVTIDGDEVDGIFGDGYVESNFTQSKAPAFTYPEKVKPDVVGGSVLIKAGVTYIVKVIQPDGTGINKLILELQ